MLELEHSIHDILVVGNSAFINYGEGTVLELDLQTGHQITVKLCSLKLLNIFVSPSKLLIGSNGKSDMITYKS